MGPTHATWDHLTGCFRQPPPSPTTTTRSPRATPRSHTSSPRTWRAPHPTWPRRPRLMHTCLHALSLGHVSPHTPRDPLSQFPFIYLIKKGSRTNELKSSLFVLRSCLIIKTHAPSSGWRAAPLECGSGEHARRREGEWSGRFFIGGASEFNTSEAKVFLVKHVLWEAKRYKYPVWYLPFSFFFSSLLRSIRTVLVRSFCLLLFSQVNIIALSCFSPKVQIKHCLPYCLFVPVWLPIILPHF